MFKGFRMIIKTINNKIFEIYRENNKKIVKEVKDFYPYFYVLESEQIPENSQILKIESGFTSLFGDKLKKITMKRPKDVKEFRLNFSKTFEADVLYKNRYLIDRVNHQEHNYEYRICFMDIEIDARKGFPYPERAEYPITIIVCFDTILNKYIIFIWREDQEEKVDKQEEQSIYYFKDEKSMLLKFIKFINSTYPEIITGWNVLTFDFQYIINRMKNLQVNYYDLSPFKWVNMNKFQQGIMEKVDITIDGIEVIDLMQVYIKFSYIKAFNASKKLENYSLKAVSQYEEIGEKYKLDNNVSLADMWTKDLQTTINYCKHDVYLLLEIEKKLKMFKFMDSLKKIVGCELKDTLANSRIIDIYILRHARKKEVVLLSADKNVHETYKGPLIESEKIGLVKNIAGFDFVSMYPSIIQTFNMSPEVKNIDKEGIKINNLIFSKNKKGFMVEVIEELINLRYEWKKQLNKVKFNSSEYLSLYDKQTSIKTIVNSVYGIFGYKNSRMYDYDIASTVTFIARELTSKTKEVSLKMDYKTVYLHTDSCFIKLPDDLSIDVCITESEKLRDLINKELNNLLKKYSIEKSYIKVELEKFFKSAVFLEEARYFALLVYQDGKFIEPVVRITGYDAIKRDTPRFIRLFLQNFYKKVLELSSFDEIKSLIQITIEEMKIQDLDDIGITIRISKNINEYDSNSQHIRAAEYSNKYLGTNFKRTDYVKLIFIKSIKNGIKIPYSDVIGFDISIKDKIKEYFEIDWERMIERTIFMKIEKICDVINLDINELKQLNKGQEILAKWS